MHVLARLALYATLGVTSCVTSAGPTVKNNELQDGTLNGSEKIAERTKKLLEDPVGGVVVNRTVTVLGHDFFRYFSAWWRETDDENRYTISIHERPTARWGSEIWVQYRRDRVFHTFLPPARSQTKEISKVAVDIVYENITENEIQRALFQSADLGPEEM